MKFNFKNLSENTKRIRIIPKNDTELFANIGVDNPTAMIDEAGIFSVCLSPYETPTNSCDDSPSSIILPLTGGSYYEIVDGDAVYGSILRNLIVGASDQNYFEGLRFEVVTGTDIDPTTVRIVNLTDNSKRIKFTAIDANSLNERYFAEKGLNYAETVLAHNVESLGDGFVFEFCLGPSDVEIPPNEVHFTTIEGTIDYSGVKGDQIVLNDGNTITVDASGGMFDIVVPSGKHKIVLTEIREHGYVGLGGEALVELHSFPALSSVNMFGTNPNSLSPNLVKVPTVLPSNLTNIGWMFYGATSFNQDISSWDTSNVTDMIGMFQDASVFDQDISMWDTSNVTDMNSMFYNATSFNQPLNNWDVSNVTDIGSMFTNATSFNQDISNWNVSNVTNMNSMFADAIAFDQPLNNWDVSNVIDMAGMFYGAIAFNQDLSQWCVSNITDSPHQFDQGATNWTLPRPVWGTCPSGDNGEIPPDEWHFTTIEGEFSYTGNPRDQILLSDGTIVEVPVDDYSLEINVPAGKHKVKFVELVDRSNYIAVAGEALVELRNFPALSSIDALHTRNCTNLVKVPTVLPSNLKNLNELFSGATSFNQDISMWDTSNVTQMVVMFGGATSFNQPIGSWNVSNVEYMSSMFEGATAFNQPLNNWDVSNVFDMSNMFTNATSFNQPLNNWDVSNVEYMIAMFFGASAFNQDLSSWCVTKITQEPDDFSLNSPLTAEHKPVWGTCPS